MIEYVVGSLGRTPGILGLLEETVKKTDLVGKLLSAQGLDTFASLRHKLHISSIHGIEGFKVFELPWSHSSSDWPNSKSELL